jgi:orotidine-5'-phosphate decarboxylase
MAEWYTRTTQNRVSQGMRVRVSLRAPMKYPVIVALDGLTLKESLSLAKEIKGLVWGFKVHELVIREGFEVIKKLKKFGKVFVDLKFYDIPTTVAKEVAALSEYGADLITVHASGGAEMLRAAVDAGGNKIVAVTVLTSLPATEARKVPTLAALARTAGVTNIVCSAREAGIVRRLNKSVTIITPGIRGPEDTKGDQKRTATAAEALMYGANLLVIGRPITKAPNAQKALQNLFKD